MDAEFHEQLRTEVLNASKHIDDVYRLITEFNVISLMLYQCRDLSSDFVGPPTGPPVFGRLTGNPDSDHHLMGERMCMVDLLERCGFVNSHAEEPMTAPDYDPIASRKLSVLDRITLIEKLTEVLLFNIEMVVVSSWDLTDIHGNYTQESVGAFIALLQLTGLDLVHYSGNFVRGNYKPLNGAIQMKALKTPPDYKTDYTDGYAEFKSIYYSRVGVASVVAKLNDGWQHQVVSLQQVLQFLSGDSPLGGEITMPQYRDAYAIFWHMMMCMRGVFDTPYMDRRNFLVLYVLMKTIPPTRANGSESDNIRSIEKWVDPSKVSDSVEALLKLIRKTVINFDKITRFDPTGPPAGEQVENGGIVSTHLYHSYVMNKMLVYVKRSFFECHRKALMLALFKDLGGGKALNYGSVYEQREYILPNDPAGGYREVRVALKDKGFDSFTSVFPQILRNVIFDQYLETRPASQLIQMNPNGLDEQFTTVFNDRHARSIVLLRRVVDRKEGWDQWTRGDVAHLLNTFTYGGSNSIPRFQHCLRTILRTDVPVNTLTDLYADTYACMLRFYPPVDFMEKPLPEDKLYPYKSAFAGMIILLRMARGVEQRQVNVKKQLQMVSVLAELKQKCDQHAQRLDVVAAKQEIPIRTPERNEVEHIELPHNKVPAITVVKLPVPFNLYPKNIGIPDSPNSAKT